MALMKLMTMPTTNLKTSIQCDWIRNKESIDKDQSYQSTEESSLSLGTEANNEMHVLHPVSQQSKGIGLGRRFGNRFRRRSQIEANEVSVQAKNAIDITQPDADKKLAESGHLSYVLHPATKSNALVKSSESAHFSVSTNNHATVDFSGNNHQSHGAENSFDQEKAEVKKSIESTRDNNDHAGNMHLLQKMQMER